MTLTFSIQLLWQMIGFTVLTFLPGILVIQILRLDKLDVIEKVVLSVGISIAFTMLFGLFIDIVYYSIGYNTPLSKNSLITSFSIVIVLLYIIGTKINKEKIFIFSNFKFHLSRIEKLFLTVPILFPALSIFGTYVMNTNDDNSILILLLLLIPTYIVFVGIFNKNFPRRLYSVIIFLVGISLLLLLALRSNYIIGTDTHIEYYIFQETLNNLHWKISGSTPLDATLSISLLPTIYQSIFGIQTDFLFKIFYSLIYSITPIAVYILSKRYVKEFYAFLSSCFFMFQSFFLNIEANSRTSIAIFFFALTMMVLFSDNLIMIKKKIFIIIFITLVIISHYSTAYIFFFIMSGTLIGLKILKRYKNFKSTINLEIILFFSILLFFWYSQITGTAFNSGIHFIGNTINNLNGLFVEESRHESIQGILGKNIESDFPYKVQWVSMWATFIFIGIGIINFLISKIMSKNLKILNEIFDPEYFLVTLFCSILLMISIVFPYISRGYGMDRLYGVTIVPLSTFFVIGGVTISTYTKIRDYIIIMLVLIPYFFSITGITYEMYNIHQSIILNSKGELYDRLYVYDQESYSAKWLKNNTYEKAIITSDVYGKNRLISQGHIISVLYAGQLIEDNVHIKDEYVYLDHTSVAYKKMLGADNKWYDITENTFYKDYKIYSNGGSDIWKGPGKI